MLTPTDMGGYYRIDASVGSAILDSAPCLGGVEPAPSQSGRATSALLGPDRYGSPTFVEVAASYPAGQATGVYRALTTAIMQCLPFSVDFAGTHQSVFLRSATTPAVGDAVSAWRGTFELVGQIEQLQVGVIVQGDLVVVLVYFDSLPPSNPIMGDFSSTLSNAIGKLA